LEFKDNRKDTRRRGIRLAGVLFAYSNRRNGMTGRKSKYETHVKPYLPEIEKWCNTMTEAQICKRLGVGKSA